MILDERNEFADGVSVAAAAGNAVMGDVIDLGANPTLRDIGNGEPVYLVIRSGTEIITGGVAGTITFSLESDSTADLATSATVHWTSKAFVTDDTAANDAEMGPNALIAIVALPVEAKYERYLGIRRTIGTTTITAGTVDAFLTLDPHGWRAYPEGQN